MSYALHVYLLNKEIFNENVEFDAIKSIFPDSERVACTIQINTFTKKKYVKMLVDTRYSISVFFDEGVAVQEDLHAILNCKADATIRIRFLFAPDPQNDFDDIAVIILDYLEKLNDVVIYSTGQNKIIFNSAGI